MSMEPQQPPIEQMGGMHIGEMPQQPPMQDYGYGRGQSPMAPPQDPRLPTQAAPPYSQVPPPGPGGRSSGRPPMMPPFPTEPHAQRPPPGYDGPPPMAPEGYQVCRYLVYSDVTGA